MVLLLLLLFCDVVVGVVVGVLGVVALVDLVENIPKMFASRCCYCWVVASDRAENLTTMSTHRCCCLWWWCC